jgi:hypothetical protein
MLATVLGQRFADVHYIVEATLFVAPDETLVFARID